MTEPVHPTGSRTGWRRHAACHNTNPDPFTHPGPRIPTLTRRTCGHCPARADCLTEALKDSAHHGIWGGLTDSERRTQGGTILHQLQQRRRGRR